MLGTNTSPFKFRRVPKTKLSEEIIQEVPMVVCFFMRALSSVHSEWLSTLFGFCFIGGCFFRLSLEVREKVSIAAKIKVVKHLEYTNKDLKL